MGAEEKEEQRKRGWSRKRERVRQGKRERVAHRGRWMDLFTIDITRRLGRGSGIH